MQDCTIRRALIDDLPALTTIYNQAIEDGKTADTVPYTTAGRRSWFDAHQDRQYPLFVADTGSPVGYATLSSYREGRPALRSSVEISYYVHRDMHRRGLGRALLQHALTTSRVLGYQHALAILLDSNSASIKLLENHGFTCWGNMPNIAEIQGRTCGHVYYGRHL